MVGGHVGAGLPRDCEIAGQARSHVEDAAAAYWISPNSRASAL